MRKFLLTLLVVLVIAGALAGVGFAGYRFGYQRGALAASNGDLSTAPFALGKDFHWQRMPMDEFHRGLNRDFQPRFGPGGFRMMDRGAGFRIFPLFGHLIQLAILSFIVWLIYKLLTGWRISFTRATVESPRAEPVQSVESEPKSE